MLFFVQYNLDARAAAHHGQPRGEAEGARDRRDDPPRGHQRGRRHQLQRLGVPDDVVIETTDNTITSSNHMAIVQRPVLWIHLSPDLNPPILLRTESSNFFLLMVP